MNQQQQKTIKIIAAAAAITIISFIPYWLMQKHGKQISNLTAKLNSSKITTDFHEAMYYEELAGKRVQCNLCPNRCILENKQIGLCKVRQNIEGKLYSLVYGRPVTVHVDPIEKKPLFHFLPGSQAYSLATVGCNLACQHCQNWDISQAFPDQVDAYDMTPRQIVADAINKQTPVIAFTYNEPIIFYEYMLDIAKLARENKLKTVMISGGYINKEPLLNLLPYLDGIKIDLKGFTDDFYLRITNGRLQPVLDTIKTIARADKHLEIVYLLIPGENDSDKEIADMSQWAKTNVGDDAIIHFSRFYPQYKMTNKPPTPISTIEKAREIALAAGLKYVYTGNIDLPEAESTYCADGTIGIERRGYFIIKNTLVRGECADGTIIPGVWE